MAQRGVSLEEIERTLNDGWAAQDAKAGTFGKIMVFEFGAQWENKFYQQKEVTVYYKIISDGLLPLTIKARYGQNFPREWTL